MVVGHANDGGRIFRPASWAGHGPGG
jgi:hypothetical protein